jgi:quercetin dioxygenase-like cupin family protein
MAIADTTHQLTGVFPCLNLFGICLTILADHGTPESRYDLIQGYFPPNTQTPLHRHTRFSEQLYVTEEEFIVWADEDKVALEASEAF